MASVEVKIVSNRLPAIAAKLPGAARQIVQKAVADVEAQAKPRAPFEFGTLRNSIQGHMTGPTSGEVSTGVEYAEYQERGTVKMPAHPFMTPAADAVRPSFEAAAKALAEGLA